MTCERREWYAERERLEDYKTECFDVIMVISSSKRTGGTNDLAKVWRDHFVRCGRQGLVPKCNCDDCVHDRVMGELE